MTPKESNKKRMATVAKNVGMSYPDYMSMKMHERYSRMTPQERIDFAAKTQSSRNSFRYKDYFLNGSIVKVMGHEPFVLDVLKTLFDENEILVSDKITPFTYDYFGKTRTYFPDIVIKNMLFEVKSLYTFTKNIDEVIMKMKAAKDNNYVPFIVMWNPRKSEMCKNDLIETISSQALIWEGRFNDYPFIGVGDKQMITEALGTHKLGS